MIEQDSNLLKSVSDPFFVYSKDMIGELGTQSLCCSFFEM